jgi:xylulokinase
VRHQDGYLLAIDVGSTTTRCVLFDLEGRSAGEAHREPRVYHPHTTWTEVEPEDWWTSVVAATGEALRRAGVPGERIAGIGLCGLKHALVPIDARGVPLARAMLWMDQRCQPQVEWMMGQHGDVIAEVLGRGSISTTPSAPKLRWIVEHEPDLLRRTEVFLLPKDFIRYRLTGTIATDPSDAGGTCLYDRRSGGWSQRMLDLIGVPAGKLPPIHGATTIAGGVTAEAAAATGLAPGTPVVVGGGDVQCTLIGADAFHTGRACLYLGTSAWLSVPAVGGEGRPLFDDCFGATATTGAALKWLVNLFDFCGPHPRPLSQPRARGGGPHPRPLSQPRARGPFASYTALMQEAEDVPPGARGLIFLPHLMGERAPRYDSQAKGVLFGLTLAHGRRDVARAVLEGCAFQLRHIAESLAPPGPGGIVAVGGGARSALWLGIMADVMGTPLLVPRVLEAGALGAAILAGVGVGVYPGVQEAAGELVQIVDRIAPDGARHERYGKVYALFLELEDRVASLYGSVPMGGETAEEP